MATIQDLSPKLSGIKPASQELALPSLFQDTPNQMVGGFVVGSKALTQGKVSLSGVDQRLLMGDATDPTTGVGIFMGDDGQGNGNYDFRIGDPAGVYLQWDASAATLTVTGFIPDGGAANDVNTNVTTIDGGKITAQSITATQIEANTITASQIAAGTITATEIAASTITASKLSVSTLSAITASLGTVNVGGSGNGNGVIRMYDSGGTQQINLDNSAFTAYGSSRIVFANSTGDTTWRGALGISSGQFVVASLNGYPLTLGSNQSVLISSLNGQDVTIQSTNNLNLNTSGSIKLNGVAKTAIVETSHGYRALYCAEAAEVWFFDFCKTKDCIDPMFLEVTEGEMKFIQCDDGTYQVWRRRKGFGNTRFEAKTEEEYTKNNEFWRH